MKTPIKISLKLSSNDNNSNSTPQKQHQQHQQQQQQQLLSPKPTSSADDRSAKAEAEVPRSLKEGPEEEDPLERLAASALSLLDEGTASTSTTSGRLAHLLPRTLTPLGNSPSPSPSLTSLQEDEILAGLYGGNEFKATYLSRHCLTPAVTEEIIADCCGALIDCLTRSSIAPINISSAINLFLSHLIPQECARLHSPHADLTPLLTNGPFLRSVAVLMAWMPRLVSSSVPIEEFSVAVKVELFDVLMGVEVVMRAFPHLLRLPLLQERLKNLQQYLLEEAIFRIRDEGSRDEGSRDEGSRDEGVDERIIEGIEGISKSHLSKSHPSKSHLSKSHPSKSHLSKLPFVYSLIKSELPKSASSLPPALHPLRSPQRALESLTGSAQKSTGPLSRLELFFRQWLRLASQRLRAACWRAGLSGEVCQMAWEWVVEMMEAEGVDGRVDLSGRGVGKDVGIDKSGIDTIEQDTHDNLQDSLKSYLKSNLFLDRHLNQILLATLYTTARLHNSPRTFHQLSACLPCSPLGGNDWMLRVRGVGDFYTFYNGHFLPPLQQKIQLAIENRKEGPVRSNVAWRQLLTQFPLSMAPLPGLPRHALGTGVSLSVGHEIQNNLKRGRTYEIGGSMELINESGIEINGISEINQFNQFTDTSNQIESAESSNDSIDYEEEEDDDYRVKRIARRIDFTE